MTSTFAYIFAKQKPPIKVNPTIVPMICNYPRNILTEPVYSPRNAIWQKVYEGWAAHSQEILLYDYYDSPVHAPAGRYSPSLRLSLIYTGYAGTSQAPGTDPYALHNGTVSSMPPALSKNSAIP